MNEPFSAKALFKLFRDNPILSITTAIAAGIGAVLGVIGYYQNWLGE